MSTHHIRKPPEHIEDRVNVMYIYTYINKTVIRNYAENANEISNPKNTSPRQTKVIIRFVRFHFAFHSDNSGPIPFFFHVGKNIRWLVQRQTWRLDVSARLQMSTPPQGSQHRRGIVMGYESSPGQLYQQLDCHGASRAKPGWLASRGVRGRPNI